MRTLRYLTPVVTATIIALASAANAGTTYKGLAKNNPDLTGNPQLNPDVQMSTSEARHPEEHANVYKGLAQGNSDLVSPIHTNKTPTKKNPDIYGKMESDPDLSY